MHASHAAAAVCLPIAAGRRLAPATSRPLFEGEVVPLDGGDGQRLDVKGCRACFGGIRRHV
jgi:hypothetical protein